MKTAITPDYTFTPAAKTLDLSAVAGFDVKKLYGVINQTTGNPIFISGSNKYRIASVSGSTLTFTADMAGAAATDDLLIIYDEAQSSGATGLTDTQLRASPLEVEVLNTSLQVELPGTIELGAASLAALESISVAGPLTDSQLRASPISVSGTFWQTTQPISVADLPLPSGASTSALQTAGNATLAAIDTKLGATLNVSVQAMPDVSLSAASLAALESISVSGTVDLGASSLAALESISVSGPLTDAQLRATALPVSGTFWQATQPVSVSDLPLPTGAATSALQTSGNETLSAIDAKLGSPLTVSTGLVQGVTDAQLRASPIDVSGPLTDTELRAAPLVVDVQNLPDVNVGSMPAVNLSAATIAAIAPVAGLTNTELRATPLEVDVPGVATDATLAALNAMQTELKVLNDTMLALFSAILEKMPRVTGNDQAAVSVENTPSVTVSSGTVTTVTTCSTVTNQNQMGLKFVSGDNQMLAGAVHIYSNIITGA